MLTVFSKKNLEEFTCIRMGEKKIGQVVASLSPDKPMKEILKKSPAKFVVFGIQEDIGVRLNGGKGGAHTSFMPAVKAFLNNQQNQFIQADKILILGYLNCNDELLNFNISDENKGHLLVKKIDEEVAKLVQLIVELRKIPIIIGGGHNNAYGNLKGLSRAKNKPVNAVNLDAHSDLRALEGRHSGNGFSYALQEGYLDKYFIFGLHESYTPQYIFEQIYNNKNLAYTTFEALEIYRTANFKDELQRAKNFACKKTFGIELDLDCVQYFPSSAMTPSGFTPQQARRFVYHFAKVTESAYLHICEAAPSLLSEPSTNAQVGKFIAYLISDFVKAKGF
ncbi:MAG: formimidoylglutamase [Tenacibaculum sp.]